MALVFLGLGCSTGPEYGPAVYYETPPDHTSGPDCTSVEDCIILARIKTKLYSDELVDQGQLDIRVSQGVVFVEGRMQDIYQLRMITDLIRTVEGVVRVEN